jgi:ERCC4-type nuclease
MLILDDRERALVAQCTSLGMDASVRRLPLADVLVVGEGEAVCLAVERKTLADLRSSLVDGRFVDQRGRLIETYHREHVVYIIEGDLADYTNVDIGVVVSLQFRDRVTVIRTHDVRHTARMLHKLDTCANTERLCARVRPPETVAKVAKANTDTPGGALAAFLRVLPGVSPKMASAVVTRFPSVKALCALVEEDDRVAFETLKDIQCGSRKLGPVISKRIVAAMA